MSWTHKRRWRRSLTFSVRAKAGASFSPCWGTPASRSALICKSGCTMSFRAQTTSKPHTGGASPLRINFVLFVHTTATRDCCIQQLGLRRALALRLSGHLSRTHACTLSTCTHAHRRRMGSSCMLLGEMGNFTAYSFAPVRRLVPMLHRASTT